jgi:hypothetical protein
MPSAVVSSKFKVQGSSFATPKAFGARVHGGKRRKGGSGVPPLIYHGQEAGRLFHRIGKKTGAKTWEQAIFLPQIYCLAGSF